MACGAGASRDLQGLHKPWPAVTALNPKLCAAQPHNSPAARTLGRQLGVQLHPVAAVGQPEGDQVGGLEGGAIGTWHRAGNHVHGKVWGRNNRTTDCVVKLAEA